MSALYTQFPDVWGPHYWFFLHTVAMLYPNTPNEIMKKKYYELIMNMPLYIPDPDSSKYFAHLLDEYPVQPYLDSRTALVQWTHFIHNRVNVHIGAPKMSRQDFEDGYWAKFVDKSKREQRGRRWTHLAYAAIFGACVVGTGFMLYERTGPTGPRVGGPT
jgi:hypothetical protein